MSVTNKAEILPQLTSSTNPSKLQIESLFRGMLVKRQLKNFVRVILSRYGSSCGKAIGCSSQNFFTLGRSNKVQDV